MDDYDLFISAYNVGYPLNHELLSITTYKAQLSLFAKHIYVGDKDYIAKITNNKEFTEEVIPLLVLDEDNNDLDSILGLTKIIGIITGFKEYKNKYTNNKYYQTTVKINDLNIDVMIGEAQLDKEPRIGDFVVGIFYTTAKVMRMFEGFDTLKDLKIEKSNNRYLKTFLDLYRVLYESYTIDSAYYYSRAWWSKSNRTIGQCAITAMLVYDLLGGTIMMHEDDYGQHYFNIINGKVLDLTTEQYDLTFREVDYNDAREAKRDSFKSETVIKRYNILIDNIKKTLKRMEDNDD